MSMTFGTPFDTSVKTLQNRVYEMSGCTSCLQTICPGIPIVWGRYVRVYELSLDQMSKQTKCQGVRNVMGVRNVLLPERTPQPSFTLDIYPIIIMNPILIRHAHQIKSNDSKNSLSQHQISTHLYNNNNPCLFGPILIQILIQSIDNLKIQDLQLRKHGGY